MNSPTECTTEMFKSFFEQMNTKVSKFARDNFQLDGSVECTRCSQYLIDSLKEVDMYFSARIGDVLIETSNCVYFRDQITEYIDINSSTENTEGIGGFENSTINSYVDITINDEKYIVLLSFTESNLRECYHNLTAYDSTRYRAESDPDDEDAAKALEQAEKIISDSMEKKDFEVGMAITLDEACSILVNEFSKEDCELFNFKVEEYLLKSV